MIIKNGFESKTLTISFTTKHIRMLTKYEIFKSIYKYIFFDNVKFICYLQNTTQFL